MSQYHWYHYAAFLLSTLYTAGSSWWTVRAERRLRTINRELLIQKVALDYTDRDIREVQRYLEKAPTGRMKTAPRLLKTE